jgi:hypothetical protein
MFLVSPRVLVPDAVCRGVPRGGEAHRRPLTIKEQRLDSKGISLKLNAQCFISEFSKPQSKPKLNQNVQVGMYRDSKEQKSTQKRKKNKRKAICDRMLKL